MVVADQPEVVTDREGRALLRQLAASDTYQLSARARGYLTTLMALPTPPPSVIKISLRPSFGVEGRLLKATGEPAAEGRAEVKTDGESRHFKLDAQGAFRLELQPARPGNLSLSAPGILDVRRRLPAGVAGDTLVLGDLRAPEGLIVVGRVVDGLTGAAVTQARVWAPRPDPRGRVYAAARGRIFETRSLGDGTFRLSGFPPTALTLRFEASGRARRELDIVPTQGEEEINVGDIALDPGVTVTVDAATEANGGAARLDLEGAGLGFDLLSVPIFGEQAEIEHVPPGTFPISVIKEGRLLCERRIRVNHEDVEVDCSSPRPMISGRVLLDGVPAGVGTLMWLAPQEYPGVISHTSFGGIETEESWGAARPQVNVPVNDAGVYATRDLLPGVWMVSWMPADGAPSELRRVEVPEFDLQGLDFQFRRTHVRGRVVDTDGRPVEGALVREFNRGSTAFSIDGGRFDLPMEAPGKFILQARKGSNLSPMVQLELEENTDPDPVELVLAEPATANQLSFCVAYADGQAASGAFVFFQSDRGDLRAVTTDGDGRAELRLEEPLPTSFRLAATAGGSWALGEWQRLRSSSPGDCGNGRLVLAGVGTLIVSDSGPLGPVQVIGPCGWDVTFLRGWLGIPSAVQEGRPLRLSGLPPGSYTVEVGGRTESIILEQDALAEVRFDSG